MAKQAFTRSGADASLDDIATQAGVGAGTLYRHFPTREALLAAVYRTEVEKLAAAEKRLAVELAPLEALRAWMLLIRGLHRDEEDHRPGVERNGRGALESD